MATNYFAEGAWSGDFAAGRIQDSDTVFGSGGALEGDATIFASCTATTDFLYHNDDPVHFVISNSLPLLLATLNDELKAGYTDYTLINTSTLEGLKDYQANLPTLRGRVVRVMHRNVRVDANGISLQDKPMPPPFDCFQEYRDFLRNRIEALFANARHPLRRQPMQVFSTQSKGYDTTAVNALAAPYGIDKVFTSTKSKEIRSFYLAQQDERPSDDGSPICEVLGLTCISIDRLGFTKTLQNEHYYWAGRDNNQDLNLHEIQSGITSPTLLLTGNHGALWYTEAWMGRRRETHVNDELKYWDPSGLGMGEVRLLAGFAQTAIPFIGARRFPDICRITESEEMHPWRLNNSYDRPIPRRIGEEAGIPREMFGQVKLASIVHLPTPNLPVTPELKQAFLQHLRALHLMRPVGIALLPVVQRINNFIYWKNPGQYFQNRRKHPLLWHFGYYWSRVLGRPPMSRMLWGHIDSFLYAFCVNKVRNEYTTCMAGIKPSGTGSRE